MNIEQRRFGFELEVGDGRLRNLCNRLARAGLVEEGYEPHNYHCECGYCTDQFSWDNPGYLREDGNWWPVKVQYDSSCGGEVITAPLAWSDPRWRELCSKLGDILNRDPRVPTNEHCSFHVHVEASDLRRQELANLARLMYSNEAVLFRLASQSEKHRGQENNYQYCLPLSSFQSDHIGDYGMMRNLDHALDIDPTESTLGTTKYTALNFRPLSRQNTVEFRLWDVVRQPWQMEFLVDMSVAMTQRAKKKHVARSKNGTLGRYTRTKGEVKGRTAARRLLNKVSSVLPDANKPEFSHRFWLMFEDKKWQPSWAELSRLQTRHDEYGDVVDRINVPARRRRWRAPADGPSEPPTYRDQIPWSMDLIAQFEQTPSVPVVVFESLSDLENMSFFDIRQDGMLIMSTHSASATLVHRWLLRWQEENAACAHTFRVTYNQPSLLVSVGWENVRASVGRPNVGTSDDDGICRAGTPCPQCDERWQVMLREWWNEREARRSGDVIHEVLRVSFSDTPDFNDEASDWVEDPDYSNFTSR